tara:strand:+ start:137 stop:334 length:198 start_codon:yes stop_codon:yes gene_type:complete
VVAEVLVESLLLEVLELIQFLQEQQQSLQLVVEQEDTMVDQEIELVQMVVQVEDHLEEVRECQVD